MGDNTAIEWADATWNPATGCTKVSAGCEFCYIDRTPPFRVRGRRFTGGRGDHHLVGATIPVELHPDRLDTPIRWTRPRRVFVNSLSDLFHLDIPRAFIVRVFATMALTRRHTYQVLTKRPGRMRALLSDELFPHEIALAATDIIASGRARRRGAMETPPDWTTRQSVNGTVWCPPYPLPNVWIGVTTEDQHAADVRIPELLRTPAAVRFLSVEPLLSPVRLGRFFFASPSEFSGQALNDGAAEAAVLLASPRPDWVIVGGESGGPSDRALVTRTPIGTVWPKLEAIEWVRAIRDECLTAGVAFTFKQWGGRTAKEGGRDLDGRTWDDHPPLGEGGT